MAEDCTDGDYLGAYSRFFSEFVARVNPYDQLPVSVSSYNVTEAEIVGEIINVTLQYLNQTQCPSSLQAYLVHQVIQEIKSMCKKQPEDCGFKSQEKAYTSLKLMQAITGKVNEICIRYLDNSRLALLPPPPSVPFPQVAAGGSKNCRRKMEDRYVVLHDLHTTFGIQDDSIANYYAVFDGHAGQDAAVYCATHLHQYLAESIYYPTDPERALRDAFITTDAQFLEKSKTQKVCGGTTAVCTLILNKKLYVAWVGDSTATLIKRDSVIQLVNPHRLHREDEVQRIRKMGGVVMRSMGIMRVNGILGISRAIGDVPYKPFVSGEPEIKSIPLDGTEDFLVLATDGLTDYLEPAEILTILYYEIQQNPNGFKRAHQILLQWAKHAGSKDNITVVVVLLTPASEIAAKSQNAHPFHCVQVNDILEKMNSKDKPLFLDIDDAHNAINSNILKQTVISQEPRDRDRDRDHEDDGILAASNGKHENGDADYDYSDLGPETDVDAIDDVSTMPVKNLSYEFYKDNDSNHEQDQPDKDSNVLDDINVNESTNANVNANITHESFADANLHKDDGDEDNDNDDDEDEDEDEDYEKDNNDDNKDNGVPDEFAIFQTIENKQACENVREEMNNEIRVLHEESVNDEEERVKNDPQTDDMLNVVDEAEPMDYDDSPPSPQANKPLQHALIHEADSEDSEDEWNYYPVDPNKEKSSAAVPIDIPQESRNEQETDIIPELPAENADSLLKIQSEDTEEDIKCGSPKTDTFELINTEISAEDRTEKTEEETACEEEQEKPKDMDFQLNPDAAEFIPVSPQFIGGARVNLTEDYPVSGSPFKQVPEMDDIQVPSQSEFEKEVCQRPREVDVEVEEKEEYQNGEHLQSTDYTDFLSNQQKPVGVTGNLDDSEISSTKAEFGDESGVSFLTTSEFHRTGFSTIDESFSSSERDYDIAKDPMAMSFTPSDFEAAFDKGVDLNAVHDLSSTDLEEKNGTIEKEEKVTEQSPLELQLETTDLMVVPEAEEPAEDKPAFSEEPTKLANLSLEQENSEEATFIEYADEPKTSTEGDLLQLQPESSQVEQLEIARYDHSPSTENYSAEFESEKEPISVDNEQPLSPSSVDIDETKPIDEASEDAVLPESDLQKEACPSETDTPSSLSPVPGPLESESVDPTKNTEIHSSLHADAPEFLPRQYNLQSHDVETSSEVGQPTPAEAADLGRKSPTETASTYESQLLKIDDAFGPIQRDTSADVQPADEKEMGEAVCTKPPVQENLLDFEEEAKITAKPPHIQSELTLPSFSPQQVEEEQIPSSFDDLVCPIKKPSAVTDEYKPEEVMQLKETSEKTTVIEDKTENILTEAMEPLLELTKPEGLTDSAEERPVLNLSESMQEFTGLENQLQPEAEEIAATIAEPSVVEKIHEELKKEESEDMAESKEHFKLEVEKELRDTEEKEEIEQVILKTELKEPEMMKELETKEPEMMRELETKELEMMGELETKESETIEKSEAKELEMMNELKAKETEMMKELETEETEMVKELEVKEPEIVKDLTVEETKMAKELAVEEPEIVKDLAVEETKMVKELAVEEPEIVKNFADEETKMVKELAVEEPEMVKESEVKEPEIMKELETKEVEMMKEPKTIKELETKVPEIVEESETKVPEIIELSETKISEMKEEAPKVKEEAPEVKEEKIEETATETSENKPIDAATTALVAAAVSTAAAAAGTAVAQSKSKVKTTGAKAATKTTGQKAPPKSTQTSPSKSAVSATRTSTAATKKPSTTMPARPKDLDTPKKSTILSSASSSKTSTTASKSGSKTTTSTGVTKTTTRTSVSATSKPKPSATAASSKPITTEKKPTANGDVKSLNKAAATRPTSKVSSTSKTTLAKTSTPRSTVGSTTTTKLKSSVATTKSSTTPKSATSSPSTTSIFATNTAPAKPKTPTVGNATTKPRTPTTAKSPVIDKQVKETANKQISMSRTSTGASKTSTRLFTSSSTTTTTKRVSSTTKTSTTASPTKKTTAVSKVSSKTSTAGKTITEKGKILQNGVSEKVEINAIFDDVPKKDLSPVVAPNDNQLIMSSD